MSNTSGLSFLDTAFRAIYPQDFTCRQQAEEGLRRLAVPGWSLGNLHDLAVDLAGMTRALKPPVARKSIVVMVGDHGSVAEKEGRESADGTVQLVGHLLQGNSGMNILARRAGAGVCVVDVGTIADFGNLGRESGFIAKKIGRGTANIATGPAMSRTHAVMVVEAGVEVANQLAAEVDLFGAGAIGLGNFMASTAIAAVFTGQEVAALTRGDDAGLQDATAAIEAALRVNQPNPKDGFDVLAKVGGFEIGAIAGLIIGAAAKCKPVLVDGFAATAGAMIAVCLEPFVRDYLICAQRDVEPGHGVLLAKLQKKPLLDWSTPLGTGAGAALAMPLVEAAAAMLADGALVAKTGNRVAA